EGLRSGLRCPVEGADERRDDGDPVVELAGLRRGLGTGRRCCRRGRGNRRGPREGDAAAALDLDLVVAGLDVQPLDGGALELLDQVSRLLPDGLDQVAVRGGSGLVGVAHVFSPTGGRTGCWPGAPNRRKRSYRCSSSCSGVSSTSSRRLSTIAV